MNQLSPEDLELVKYYRDVALHQMRIARLHTKKADKLGEESPEKMAHLQTAKAVYTVIDATLDHLSEILGIARGEEISGEDILVQINAILADGNYRLGRT